MQHASGVGNAVLGRLSGVPIGVTRSDRVLLITKLNIFVQPVEGSHVKTASSSVCSLTHAAIKPGYTFYFLQQSSRVAGSFIGIFGEELSTTVTPSDGRTRVETSL